MIDNSNEFEFVDVGKDKPIKLLVANGKSGLIEALQHQQIKALIEEGSQDNSLEKFMRSTKNISAFFRSSAANKEQKIEGILYRNGQLEYLIIPKGQNFYSYDLKHGRVAPPEVKQLLGDRLRDVSRDFLLEHGGTQDLGRASEESEVKGAEAYNRITKAITQDQKQAYKMK